MEKTEPFCFFFANKPPRRVSKKVSRWFGIEILKHGEPQVGVGSAVACGSLEKRWNVFAERRLGEEEVRVG